MIPTLLGVALLVFVLMRIMPGDIVLNRYAGEGGGVSEELLQVERIRLGLHHPMWKQFAIWIWGAVQFDFGISMWTEQPISYEIGLRFQLSLQVAIMGTVLATVLAIPWGPSRRSDRVPGWTMPCAFSPSRG